MHRLLKRQLHRFFPDGIPESQELSAFICAIDDSYEDFSNDEAMMGHSLDISCQELNERNDVLNSLLDALPDTCLWIDESGLIRDIRPGQYLDLLFGSLCISKHTSMDEVPFFKEHRQFRTHLDQCRRLNRLMQHEYLHKVGAEKIYIEVRLSPLQNKQVLVLLRDITVRKVVEQLKNAALEESRSSSKQLQELINCAPIGIMLIDASMKIIMVNSYCASHLRIRRSDLLGQQCDTYIAPAFRKEYAASIENQFHSQGESTETRIDVDMCSPFHDPFATEIAFSLFRYNGQTVLTQAFIDISSRKQMELELRRLAQTDPLTGVANRRHFTSRAEFELSRCLVSGEPLSLLSMDLDHFKRINDTYGHAMGDEVLKAFCRMLESIVGVEVPLGRFGGEEFTLLLPRQDKQTAEQVAQTILATLPRCGINTEKGLLNFTASIGIASIDEAKQRLEALLNLADERLYLAKASGRNCYCSGNPPGDAVL